MDKPTPPRDPRLKPYLVMIAGDGSMSLVRESGQPVGVVAHPDLVLFVDVWAGDLAEAKAITGARQQEIADRQARKVAV